MDYRGPFTRIDQLLRGRLAETVQTPVIRHDFTVVSHVVGRDPWWEPRLACARQLIAKRDAERRSETARVRKDAHRRYEAHRDARAMEQARLAKAGGAGKKQQ